MVQLQLQFIPYLLMSIQVNYVFIRVGTLVTGIQRMAVCTLWQKMKILSCSFKPTPQRHSDP